MSCPLSGAPQGPYVMPQPPVLAETPADIPPDIEWEQMCDKQPDGSIVEFMIQSATFYDASYDPITPPVATYYQLDKVTPYTLTGELVACGECETEAPLGVITDTSLLDT